MKFFDKNDNVEVYDELPNTQPMNEGPDLIDENYDKVPNPPTHFFQDILLTFLGLVGLNLMVIVTQAIAFLIMSNNGYSTFAINEYFASYDFLSIVNFVRYSIIFLIMIVVIFITKTLLPILQSFKKFRTYLFGIGYGFIVIFLSVVYNNIIGMIFKDFGSNENQNAVESVISLYPLLSVIWIPFLGPIVEEIAYRFGLFNGLKKINRTLAYVATGLLFGLIHFNLPAQGIENYWGQLGVELLNLPGYIISGLAFNYIFEKENLGTSIVAHVTNNLVSYLVTVFAMTSL